MPQLRRHTGGGHESNTHPRLKRTPALLVIVSGLTVSFPSETFHRAHGIPGLQDPMMSSFQRAGGKREKSNSTYESTCIDTV